MKPLTSEAGGHSAWRLRLAQADLQGYTRAVFPSPAGPLLGGIGTQAGSKQAQRLQAQLALSPI